MTQKPKIQYVGMFYNHGSEARKLKIKEEKAQARAARISYLPKYQVVYVDPVALIAIAVAVVMLAVMVMGAVQIRDDWTEYRQMSGYVAKLKAENAQLEKQYRSSYDLEDIAEKADALGMVPASEVEVERVYVVTPKAEPEMTRVEEVKWFLEGLFA